jgi:hypothetical protein
VHESETLLSPAETTAWKIRLIQGAQGSDWATDENHWKRWAMGASLSTSSFQQGRSMESDTSGAEVRFMLDWALLYDVSVRF